MNTLIVMLFSIFSAFVLTVIPLPTWALWYRPAWVPLMVIYWIIACPQNIGLLMAWFIGLLLDTMTGSVLGEHALGMVLIAFLAMKLHRQMQLATLWQQSVSILLLTFIFQLAVMLSEGMLGQTSAYTWFWIPAVTSMFIWPWLVIMLRDSHYQGSVRRVA